MNHDLKKGDWLCGGCKAHNFASRAQCYKCKAAKGAGEFFASVCGNTLEKVRSDRAAELEKEIEAIKKSIRERDEYAAKNQGLISPAT